MTTPDRFDIHHEQYLAEWVEANLRHLYEVCADYVPWLDAKSSSDDSACSSSYSYGSIYSMDEIGIEQARNQLGEIIDRARFTGHTTLLTRKGRPAAVVVNADWYESALSFIGEFRPHLGRFEILHKDGDPQNNAPENLELRERPS